MRKFLDHSRAASALSTTSHTTSATSQAIPDPFATPPASVFGATSGFQYSDAGGGKYFRSRRIRKDENHVPPVFKKDPKEKWLCIIPLAGVCLGLLITAAMIYMKIGRSTSYNYCPILDDDFSSGALNPAIWTKEIEVGGYGYCTFLLIYLGFC
jgi:hypothetical protein